MAYDIRKVKSITDLIGYFSENLGWDIDVEDFEDIEDISYDFEAADIGLKDEAFAKISSLRQLQPLVDNQKWGIFCVEFDSNKFEPSALKKILSGLVPKKRNSADHAVWAQQDLLFICNWGADNNRTIGVAHFEDKESGLPQIKMISCAPALEDFTQIKVFEDRLSKLTWPRNTSNIAEWREAWASAFTTAYKQVIQDSSTLTIQLAAEAQNIRNRILDILEVETANGYVHLLYEKFKATLIHDMTEQQFADMYAQTVVYGLFSARCLDASQDSFCAAEAIDCIPNTNPFLKRLMRECLGSESRGKLSFDELEIGNVVELLVHTKTDAIIQDFNRQTGGGREDPVIHFYEEFLTAYDKAQKVQRGVYYTPQPVVNFIVRAVDSILKTEFGYEDGLASTETKKVKVMRQSQKRVNGRYTEVAEMVDVPAVQILDPATGTGTFLRQTILQIYENYKQKHRGLSQHELNRSWSTYVDQHLLPRLNGFELMMAPYAVAHMKLAMVLKDTGYNFSGNARLQVYLTNALEEAGNSMDQISMFDDPLAIEAVEANKVKKNKAISVIIGNPPYAASSTNNGEWILSLISDYKHEPGSPEKLNERNPKALNDDYVKFLRFGCYILDNSNTGILAFINNHAFIDNPTFRGMRYHLLEAYDEAFILNLHGNSLVGEKAPDGGKDVNVFNIQQGVSINIFIKKNSKKANKLATVHYCDVYGERETKYNWLNATQFGLIDWEKLNPIEPFYFFSPKSFDNIDKYNQGFMLSDLFIENLMGVASYRDELVVDMDKEKLKERIVHFCDQSFTDDQIRGEYFRGKAGPKYLPGDTDKWKLATARRLIADNDHESLIRPYAYRPFDKRYIYYSPDMVDRDREKVMKHFVLGDNYGLAIIRINRDDLCTVLITDEITDKTIVSSKDNASVFPLYLYKEFCGKLERSANMNNLIVAGIEKRLGMRMRDSSTSDNGESFTPFDLLCYIYSYLYSTKYHSAYSDLLKSDFPRIPYPSTKREFRLLCDLGFELIKLHLMTDEILIKEGCNFAFLGNGDNRVQKAIFDPKQKAIYINKTQCFTNISEDVWNMYIGTYQPLQKWMKDRRGMLINDEDIVHYQSMIVALIKTKKTIDYIDQSINL